MAPLDDRRDDLARASGGDDATRSGSLERIGEKRSSAKAGAMSRRDAVGMVGLTVTIGAVALLIGLIFGPKHWSAAGLAMLICLPTGFGTLWIARYLANRHPLGSVFGMMIGTLGRAVVAFGGGAGIFFLSGAFEDFRIGFWLWLLAIYLLVLVVETVLLAKPIRHEQEAPIAKG